MSCLDSLWTAESGWNPNAQNPTSTAYGIPQFLDATWASTGIAKTSDPYKQIDAGLIYIGNRYGSSCAAWSFHQANNWY
jgi:membrane-bound lytic murein transglycosylase MltF